MYPIRTNVRHFKVFEANIFTFHARETSEMHMKYI